MPSSLSWTDAEGAATLTNGKLTPADRFADWTVSRRPIGPESVQLSSGRIHRTRYRADQLVAFEVRHIPEDQVSLMARLQYHLLKGGTVLLVGDRTMAGQFSPARLAPGTEPDISQSDSQLREYTFSVTLRSSVFSESGSGPGGASPIEPPAVADLMIWYKADALLPTHGQDDTVTTWLDSSGNDIDAIARVGGAGFMKLNVLNGMPVVECGINNQLYSEESLPGWAGTEITGRTLFAVMRDVDTRMPPLNGGARACGLEAFSSWNIQEDGAWVRTGFWEWSANNVNVMVPVAASITTWHILTVHATQSTGIAQLYVDGVAEGAPFSYGGNLVSDLTYYINGYTAAGGGPHLQHAEHIVYNRPLTGAELNGVHAYLLAKYDL